MKSHIVIDGNAFYEVDEECLQRKREDAANAQTAKGQMSRSRQKNAVRTRRGGSRT